MFTRDDFVHLQMRFRNKWWIVENIADGGQGSVSRAIQLPPSAFERFHKHIRSSRLLRENGHADHHEALVAFFTAFHLFQTSRVGALKEIKQDRLDRSGEAAHHRFAAEIRILQNLDHPAVVKILEADPENRWFVMEFMTRGSLRGHLHRFKGRFRDTLLAIRPLVEAVAQMHKNGHVHRDIKPENVFVGDFGELILGDFGLVHLDDPDHEDRLTQTNENLGSWQWMPPWAVGMRVEEVSPNFDVFTLAKTIWAMLYGLPRKMNPFPNHLFDHAQFSLEANLAIRNKGWAQRMNTLFQKCIVDRPEKCIRDAGGLLHQIDAILRSTRDEPEY